MVVANVVRSLARATTENAGEIFDFEGESYLRGGSTFLAEGGSIQFSVEEFRG